MNFASTVLAIAATFVTGWCILRTLWPTGEHGQGRAIVAVRVCLALGLGQAVAAVHYLLWRATCSNVGLLYRLADCVFVPVLAWLMARVWATKAPASGSAPPAVPGSENTVMTATILAITVVVSSTALCICLAHTCFEPLGQWDGWAIWNLKARFMFRGGDDWTGMFSRHIWFSHPDYPLLIPGSVARLWTQLGFETTVVPQLLGMAYTTLVVGLLFASLVWLRGVLHACIAVLVLVSFEPFLTYGGAQMSDIPLSFYVLAAMVALAIAGRSESSRGRLLVLAGLLAGCGLVVKNEAQPITLALMCAMACAARIEARTHRVVAGLETQTGRAAEALARKLAPLRSSRSRNTLQAVLRTRPIAFLLGAVPFVLVLVVQKLCFAGSTYLVADQPSAGAFVRKIVDVGRHWTIVEFLVTWNFTQPSILLLLAIPVVCGFRTQPRDQYASLTGIIAVSLTFVIYYAVFLVMPYDLRNLLESFPRVELHFWPALIFTVLLAAPIPRGRAA